MLQRFRGEENLPSDSPEANLAAAWNTLDVVMNENAQTVQQTLRDVTGSAAAARGNLNIGAQYELLLGMRVPDIVAATSGLQRAVNALRGRQIDWRQPIAPGANSTPVEVSGETEYAARSGYIVGALVSPNVDRGVVALVEVGAAPDVITGEYVHLPNMYDIVIGPAPQPA